MTYKQIEGAREVRMWLGQIVIPAVLGAVAVVSNPDARDWLNEKFRSKKKPKIIDRFVVKKEEK